MAGMVADLPIECSVALQTYQQMLDVLHQKVSKVTLESRHLRGESSVELTTFDLSASLQKANVHLADRLNCLRGKEVEIARFSRQVTDLVNVVTKAKEMVHNPPLDMRLFVTDCARMREKMAASALTKVDILEKLSVLNGTTTSKSSEYAHHQSVLESEWDQVSKSLERVVSNQQTVVHRFLKMWREWSDKAKEEMERLKPSGFTLSKISAKHSQAQLLSQNSKTIIACLEALPVTDQVKGLLEGVCEVSTKAIQLEGSLGKHLSKLREYMEEYSNLKSWLADMTVLVQGEQHSVKRQTLCQQLMIKEKSLKRLQELTKEVKDLDATSSERTRLLVKANDLFDSWDRLCQQCVPAGVMKLTAKKERPHQEEFSSPNDMLKWLMSITTKLQPQGQYSNQQQLEDALLDAKAIKEELSSLKENYEKLVSREGDESEATWIANQQKRLRSLWQEVNEMLSERIEGLETVYTMWTEFDIKKERILEFVKGASKRLDHPLSISASTSLVAVDEELQRHGEFCCSVVERESDVQELRMLSTSLLNYHHGNNQTQGLQEVMSSLTDSYTKVKTRSEESLHRLEVFSEKWRTFFDAFKKLQHCATHLQVRASELKTPPTTMKTITTQKEIIKTIMEEEVSRQEVVDSAHLALYHLLEQSSHCPLDTHALSDKVDMLARKVNNAMLLARTKQSVLEGALLERQQIIDQLALQTSWLGHAQSLVHQLRPLGRDLASVEKQYDLMKGFWVEYEEQMEKMDHVLAAGAQLVSYRAETDEEKKIVELVSAQHLRLSEMWSSLREEAEHSKEVLDKVYPELVHLHSLCTQVARLLTSVEMKLTSAQPIPQTLPQLRILAAEHEEVEAILEPLEKLLEDVQLSKKNLLKMGFSPSLDLSNLISRFDRRWVEVSRYGHARGVRLNEVLAKFGSSSIPIRDGTLPRGWSKVKHDNSSPLYTMTTDGGYHSQRQHPELTVLFQSLQSKFSHVRFGHYRTALKLRELQKRLHLNLISSKNAMLILLRHFDVTTETVTINNLVEVLSALYRQVEKDYGERAKTARCVDMATSWILETYDQKNGVNLNTTSVKTAILLLCGGKLNEKLKCFFQVFADGRGEVEDTAFLQIFKDAVKIPCSIGEGSLYPTRMGPAAADSIFNNCTHVIKLDKWLSWLQSEPAILSWVTLMHRLAQSERSQHDAKCCVCKMDPIIGFRYHCLECFRTDLCQDCFWSGRMTRQHKSTHSVQEYCHSSTFSESIKDFFRVIGNKIKRSPPGVPTPPPTPTRSPAPGTPRGRYHITSVSSIESGDNMSDLSGEPPREEDLDSLIYQLEEQNKELSSQLETLQIDVNFPSPDDVSSQLLCLQESRQALQGRITFLESQNDKLLGQIGKLRNIVHQRNDFEVVEV
jgi:dystrophin